MKYLSNSTIMAQSGETYYTVSGDTNHVLLDHLKVNGDPVTLMTRNHPNTKMVAHLPVGAIWDDVENSNTPLSEKTSPREIGQLDKLEIFRRSTTIFNFIEKDPAMSSEARPSSDKTYLVAGQSLAEPFVNGPSLYGLMDATNENISVLDAAYGGSSIFQTDTSTNYWLNTDLTPGPRLSDALAVLGTNTIDGIIWAQGHGDSLNLTNGVYGLQEYINGVIEVLTQLGYATVPVYIRMPAHTHSDSTKVGFGLVREAYQYIRDLSNISSFENYDMITYDGTHPTDESNYKAGYRLGKVINGGVEPYVLSKTASTTNTTLLSFNIPMKPCNFRGLHSSLEINKLTWLDNRTLQISHVNSDTPPTLTYPYSNGYDLDLNDIPGNIDFCLRSFKL